MGAKILTVDDSKAIRLMVCRAFRSAGCDVLEASNGLEGLEIAARERPDLILLDCSMPVMDGLEMLEQLKGDAALKRIPVIMLTAESSRESMVKVAKLGARDYIRKPFKADLVLQRAAKIIGLKTNDLRPAQPPHPSAAPNSTSLNS